MKNFVDNHKLLNNDESKKNFDTNNDVIMVSRRERNKKKKSIKLWKRSKGKRYKKDGNGSKRRPPFILNKGYLALSVLIIVVIYFSLHMYFKYHFYFGSTINCINVSGKTVEEAEEFVKDSIERYTLTLRGRDGYVEEIKSSDFGLKYSPERSNEIEIIKENQNDCFWIESLIHDENYTENNLLITYDNNELKNIIDNLDVFNEENIVNPENPKSLYKDGKFQIADEIYGNKVKKEYLEEKIKLAILHGQDILDLEKEDCYESPEYTKSSEKAIKINNILNEYKDSKVIYNLGETEEIIDMSIMAQWIDIDDNYNSSINKDKVMEFVSSFADKYDTLGKTRTIYSTSGRTVKVTGGDYGFKINRDYECSELIKTLEGKVEVKREPIYEQIGMNTIINDVEKTCVEIDLTNQHLWFYKDGIIITQGNIVSGCIANGTVTPEGTYKLKYKDKDSVLVGENYRSPVSFWMPFNGNIGMHDASWRYNFGGQIYMTSGSHGCINLPYHLASDIFYNIDEGTPIICYY